MIRGLGVAGVELEADHHRLADAARGDGEAGLPRRRPDRGRLVGQRAEEAGGHARLPGRVDARPAAAIDEEPAGRGRLRYADRRLRVTPSASTSDGPSPTSRSSRAASRIGAPAPAAPASTTLGLRRGLARRRRRRHRHGGEAEGHRLHQRRALPRHLQPAGEGVDLPAHLLQELPDRPLRRLARTADQRGGERAVARGAVVGVGPRRGREGQERVDRRGQHVEAVAELAGGAGDVGEHLRPHEGVRPAAVEDHDLRARPRPEHVDHGGQRHRLERQVVGALETGVGRDQVVGAADLHAMAGIVEDDLAVLVDAGDDLPEHRLEPGLVEVGVPRHHVALGGEEVSDQRGVGAGVAQVRGDRVVAVADHDGEALRGRFSEAGRWLRGHRPGQEPGEGEGRGEKERAGVDLRSGTHRHAPPPPRQHGAPA